MDYEAVDGSQFSSREMWKDHSGRQTCAFTSVTAMLKNAMNLLDDLEMDECLEVVPPENIHPRFPRVVTKSPAFNTAEDYLKAPSPNVSNETDPDVYLNATVHVTEIDLQVDNLTAKVLSLLTFNAGVDVSIDAVNLLIQSVNAKVLLEARLEECLRPLLSMADIEADSTHQNLVLMIDDVLSSIDLNPIIATLGQDVGSVVNTTTSALGSTASSLGARSLELDNNILYSTNNYLGNTHTNRVLEQDGSIVDQYLNNDGQSQGSSVIGTYKSLMAFVREEMVERNDQTVHELEYTYSPFHGITAISAIYVDDAGQVVSAQVLAESFAGGSSTIEHL